METIDIDHRSRFRLWLFAGISALLVAGIRASGVINIEGMPREPVFISLVGAMGFLLVLFATLFVPRYYTFSKVGFREVFLLRYIETAWFDIKNIDSEARRNRMDRKASTTILAAIAGIPEVEVFVRIHFQNGRKRLICLTLDEARAVLTTWKALQKAKSSVRSPTT